MTEHKASTAQIIRASLKRRYRAERRFRLYGFLAVCFGLLAVLLLLADIIGKGHGAFRQTYVQLRIHYDPEALGIGTATDPAALALGDYDALVRQALYERFGEPTERVERRELSALISNGAGYELQARLRAKPALLGTSETLWLLADDDIDALSLIHI